MLRLALTDPQMRIVLACRSFDARNDARIRELFEGDQEHATVTVGPLPEQDVKAMLMALGINPKALSKDLIDLCSVPLHLALMGQITARGAEDVRRLKTLNDLYARYWNDKQIEIREMLGRDPMWTQVLDAIVDRMSDEHALEVSRSVVDTWKADTDAMLSASVLVEEDGRITFFHETFFDYAFARRFSGRNRTLRQLLSQDQLLFRRAQVRQVLAHSRESSPDTYERDLAYLLTDNHIRFHLKELVLAWLQTVEDPGEFEWSLVRRIIAGQARPLADRAWLTLRSPAWFRFLLERGQLATWLDMGEELKDRVFSLLSAAPAEESGAVAELLAPYQAARGSNDGLEQVLVRADLADSRELFDLLLTAIRENRDRGRRDFWYLAHDLPKSRPVWACELLGAFLEARLATGELIVERGPYRGAELAPQGLHLQEYVVPAAEQAPAAFLKFVWPSMVAVIEQTAEPAREDGLRQDQIWNLRHFGDGRGELEDELLLGAEAAMSKAAGEDPEMFDALVLDHQDTPYETVVALLFVGLSANPRRFADRAIDFAVSDRRRFRVGFSDGSHWGARRLLEAVGTHCSAQALAKLEEAVLGYYTSWERSASGHKQFGLAQFELLGGVAKATRTPAMQKRFAELQRKFQIADAWEPYGIRGGMVGSPISESSALKMNDTNWQRAMERYAEDEHTAEGDFLKGGALQLAGVLESICKKEPKRFARLALTLPDEINSVYFEAILRGVDGGDPQLPLSDAEALIERCHRLPARPCGRWLGHPLREHVNEEISNATLGILSWYAIEGEGASTVHFEDEDAEDDDHAERHLMTRGLNSVRGGMAYELARLVQADGSRIAKLEPALRSLCADEFTAVRAMAAEVVLAVASYDIGLGTELFFELTDSNDDALLATRHVRRFMVWFGTHNFKKLEPLIRRMICSPLKHVRTEGAAQAAVAALSDSAAHSLARECEQGAPELRLGVTRVYAQRLGDARHQSKCEEGLVSAFFDCDAIVRKTGAEAIRRLAPNQVGTNAGLIRKFLDSPAFEEEAEAALFALDDAVVKVPVDLALSACERALDMLSSPHDDLRRTGAVAREVSEILTRAYVDAVGREEQERALDVIDRSLEIGAYGAERALSEHDR
jgi:hypothetical protein